MIFTYVTSNHRTLNKIKKNLGQSHDPNFYLKLVQCHWKDLPTVHYSLDLSLYVFVSYDSYLCNQQLWYDV